MERRFPNVPENQANDARTVFPGYGFTPLTNFVLAHLSARHLCVGVANPMTNIIRARPYLTERVT